MDQPSSALSCGHTFAVSNSRLLEYTITLIPSSSSTPSFLGSSVEVRFILKGFCAKTFLHWGVSRNCKDGWNLPAEGVEVVSRRVQGAAQTDLVEKEGGLLEERILFGGGGGELPDLMLFVVCSGDGKEWVKDGKKDFCVPIGEFAKGALNSYALSVHVSNVIDGLHSNKKCIHKRWTIELSPRDFHLECVVIPEEKEAMIEFYSDCDKRLLLHWGFADSLSGEWRHPEGFESDGSQNCDENAVQTCFDLCSSSDLSVQSCRIRLAAKDIPFALKFVLKELQANCWYKLNKTEDFVMELPQLPEWNQAKQEFFALREVTIQKQAEEDAARTSVWDKAIEQFRQESEERRLVGGLMYKLYSLSGDNGEMDVVVLSTFDKNNLEVFFNGCFRNPTTLHWGVTKTAAGNRRKSTAEWICPNANYRPKNTTAADAISCDTPFEVLEGNNGFLQTLKIVIPSTPLPTVGDSDRGIEPEVDGIVCVLKDRNGWYKQMYNTDFQIALVPDTFLEWSEHHRELVEQIVRAEVDWSEMTLMHRYNLMREVINGWSKNRPSDLRELSSHSEETDRAFWSWMFVWGRFSYMGLLDWQRNYNTKPRDLASSTLDITHTVAEAWVKYPAYRPLTRLVLSTMSRGGSEGQAIRDKILDIMHKHKIPENRGNFYEQWHQKLHNNTTPDDVGICQAVIQFLQSGGNISEYWKVLRQHRITKERFSSYERPITSEPHMVDGESLVRDFTDYLSILQDVHDALDLKKAFGHARRFLPPDLQKSLEGLVGCNQDKSGLRLRLHSFREISVPENEAHNKFITLSTNRRQLLAEMNKPNVSVEAARDMLFLDFSLEQQQGINIMFTKDFTLQQLTTQLRDLIFSLSANDPTNPELRCIHEDWWNLTEKNSVNGCGSDSRENALLLKSLVDRASRLVGDMVIDWQNLFGAKANYLGAQVGTDKTVLDLFVDETLRGSVLFSISLCMKRTEPLLRAAAKLPSWQLISVVPKVHGELVVIDKLTSIQEKVFDIPTVLLSGAVSGEEEIPEGVKAVLVRSSAVSPDILSHVSVRARNARVLLAVCFEPQIADTIEKSLQGEWVEVVSSKDGSGLSIVASPRPTRPPHSRTFSYLFDRSTDQQTPESDIGLEGTKGKDGEIDLRSESKEWCIRQKLFNRLTVGSKSLSLCELAPQLPSNIIVPRGIALPFGCFQKTLCHDANKHTRLPKLEASLKQLRNGTSNEEAMVIFAKVKKIIDGLSPPPELLASIRSCAPEEKLISLLDRCGDEAAWVAAASVWNSLFNIRPWVSLSKAGRSFQELNMAVLIQELLPASHAFVLHTTNPFSDEGGMYGELVAGLGETLVGNYPGRALSWTMKRGEEPYVIAFPSKSIFLLSPSCLIFRSDSNGEDLQGFAGAGLFESITTELPRQVNCTYYNSKLIVDRAYRKQLLTDIANLAFIVEDRCGCAQDIEGVVIGETQLAVVQARPQV